MTPPPPRPPGRRSGPVTTAKTRRFVLRKILQSEAASTQQELVERLAQRGIRATQSTVSRDLKLLGAKRRIDEHGGFVYLLDEDRRSGFPSDMVAAVIHNETLVVVRTKVGRAQPVALELDALRLPDLLGTVAGDDTVIAIPKSVRRVTHLAAAIRDLAGLA